ncbi:MAGa7180 family putative nuclease [Mycoplasmopsis felifaucium]|uniref:YqaJ viral recombinase family protein n=1 Tax=Mycoplasmopsis felifaucium TaxID=35768 RepID=A0ABZ2RPN2_9BACT
MAKRFYNGVHYVLDEKIQVVKLLPEFHNQLLNGNGFNTQFKIFGGSSIADVLETDSYKNQFTAFCHMSRLKLPVLQKKYVNAGIILEPKIFEQLQKELDNTNQNLIIKHIEAKDVQYNYFKGLNDYIGGVPDGLIESKKIVLEMKAVNEKKLPIWTANNNAGVPIDYKKQAQLYAYLLNYNAYSIVALFLKDEDYINPENVDLTKRVMKNFNYKVNIAEAQDDIKRVTEFFQYYSVTGTSPQYQLPRDINQVEYLRCHNEQEWNELFKDWKSRGLVDQDIEFEKVA